MLLMNTAWLMLTVAPVRDRGLKSNGQIKPNKNKGRSRKGAWIEIAHAHMDGVIIP